MQGFAGLTLFLFVFGIALSLIDGEKIYWVFFGMTSIIIAAAVAWFALLLLAAFVTFRNEVERKGGLAAIAILLLIGYFVIMPLMCNPLPFSPAEDTRQEIAKFENQQKVAQAADDQAYQNLSNSSLIDLKKAIANSDPARRLEWERRLGKTFFLPNGT